MGPILGGNKTIQMIKSIYGNFDGFHVNNNALFGARCHIMTPGWLLSYSAGALAFSVLVDPSWTNSC